MSSKKSKSIEPPPVLAFSRSLAPSDGWFFECKWEAGPDSPDAWSDSLLSRLAIREKPVRGTDASRGKTGELKKRTFDTPNPQQVDVCTLSRTNDTLALEFTVKVLGNVVQPAACSSPEWLEKFQEAFKDYKEGLGFETLGNRYAYNIANARFLWRNRLESNQRRVLVKVVQSNASPATSETNWDFDSNNFSIRDFERNADQVASFGAVFAKALAGEGFALVKVRAYAQLGFGQETYPSQELIMETEKGDNKHKKSGDNKHKKSKVLYNVDGGAAMHSQKIGNALRSVDTWYEGYEKVDSPGPIAAEPYGAVTHLGEAFRAKKNASFYGLLDRFVAKDEQLSEQEKHFVVANIIRGGVFGKKADN